MSKSFNILRVGISASFNSFDRAGSVVAIVELKFGKYVTDPLKPLEDEIRDGKLGSFTVDRELHLPSTTGKPSGLPIFKYIKDITYCAEMRIFPRLLIVSITCSLHSYYVLFAI